MGRVHKRSCQFFAQCVEDLILYARQQAWLHATPEDEEISRHSVIKRAGDTAALDPPPLEGCGHLIEWLFECGPINNGGMGQAPISWTDIKDWSSLTGINITGWEAGVLKKLSSAYLSEYQQAKDPVRIAPYQPELTEDRRERVSDKIGNVFGKIAEAKKKG